MRRSRRRENDGRDTSCRLHAPTYVCRRCDLCDNVNSLVKGPAERNCKQVGEGGRRERGRAREKERDRAQNDETKREDKGKEIRPCRSLHMYARTHAHIYRSSCTYRYVRTGNRPCQAVYSLQRTCIIQADTCAMPSEGRSRSLSIPLCLYPSSDSRLASWRNKNAAGRESAVLPSRRLRERRRRDDDDDDDDNGALDAREGNVISLGH